MALLNILAYPDVKLKQKAEEIIEITEDIKKLAQDMLETMYQNNGIGLAGNQVGVLKRIIVIDLQQSEDEDTSIVMINPVIEQFSEEISECEEGCLSIVDMKEIVLRPAIIKVSYLDVNGNKQSIVADNLLATCIQHEIDHLNGILFIDRISKIKRDILLRKYKKKLKQDKQQ